MSDAFSFKCPHCGIEMEAQEEWRGLESSCPGCGKTIKIPGGDSTKQEIIPEKAKDNQHLVFARLAMQTLAYDGAQKEFNCVLVDEPTNIEALFGNILCQAHLSTPSRPQFKSLVFAYKKLEQIILDKSGDTESLRLHFIGEVGPIICSAYEKTFSALSEAKRAADFRNTINALNAVNRGIVLSNPEAKNLQDTADALMPYIGEIIYVRLFMLSIIQIDEISHDRELLFTAKRLCESCLNMDGEDDSVKELHSATQRCLREINIQDVASRHGISETEAAKYLSIQQDQENNGPLKERMHSYSVMFVFFLVLCILSGIGTLWLLMLLAMAGALKKPEWGAAFPLLAGIFVSGMFAWGAMYSRKKLNAIKMQLAECSSLDISTETNYGRFLDRKYWGTYFFIVTCIIVTSICIYLGMGAMSFVGGFFISGAIYWTIRILKSI